jgi:hypothetical protein
MPPPWEDPEFPPPHSRSNGVGDVLLSIVAPQGSMLLRLHYRAAETRKVFRLSTSPERHRGIVRRLSESEAGEEEKVIFPAMLIPDPCRHVPKRNLPRRPRSDDVLNWSRPARRVKFFFGCNVLKLWL